MDTNKLEVVYVDIDKIIPYARNPRKNDRAVDKVAASIKEYGFKQGIVVDSDNVIVVGHTRFQAAKKLGYKEVPVHKAIGLTPQQIKAYRIADNKTNEFAEWDFDLLGLELQEVDDLFTGFTKSEMNNLIDNDDKPKDPDDVPEIYEEDEPITQKGDIWVMDEHRLMCGSSIEKSDVDKLFNGKIADLLVTDPPYNVNYVQADYGKMLNKKHQHQKIANDNMSDTNFKEFLNKYYKECFEHIKPGGCFYVTFSDKEGINFRVEMVNAGFDIKMTLMWVKNHPVLARSDYNVQHEPILYGWKPGAAHYFCGDMTQKTVWNYIKNQDYSKLKKEELVEIMDKIKEISDIFEFDKPQSSELHPTMKPVALFKKMIDNSSKEGELVYDGFGGSGTTLIAAQEAGRNAYLMEYEQHYCDVIVKRWEEYTGKTAINQRTNKSFKQMLNEQVEYEE